MKEVTEGQSQDAMKKTRYVQLQKQARVNSMLQTLNAANSIIQNIPVQQQDQTQQQWRQ